MQVPLYNLVEHNKPFLAKFREAMGEVESSGQYILGPFVEKFEQELAEWSGVRHVIGVGSGTDAVLIMLLALGVGPGDEVVTSPMNYIHIAGSVQRLGATPVFADVTPGTLTLDPQAVEAVLTERTKAVVAHHLYGQMADMPALRAVCEARGVVLLGDADQAIGADINGVKAGGFGLAASVSFYPTKNLSAMGDAGAVLTHDDAFAEKLRRMRTHGLEPGYVVHELGGNFRLDALQAVLLSIKLPHLDELLALRAQHADRYDRHLEELQVATPMAVTGFRHSYNQYTLRVHGGGRDQLARALRAKGVECRAYYPKPLHLQPCFAALGKGEGDFPAAETACREVLSIPCFPEMTREQQDHVIESIREYFAAE